MKRRRSSLAMALRAALARGARAAAALVAERSLATSAASATSTASSAGAAAAARRLAAPLLPNPAARGAGRPRTMFIQTGATPNPASLMFMPGKDVLGSGEGGASSLNFASARDAMVSPLGVALFRVDGVTGVFLAGDYVTVTKSDDVEWSVLKPQVFAAIMDFYASGQDVVTDADVLAASDTAISPDDTEVVAMIKELLETRIRPAVAEDGGDIVYRGFDEDTGIVRVQMQGSCAGCPSSTVTLKSGIENMLMHYIPEVKGVVEDDGGAGSDDPLSMVSPTELAELERRMK